MDHKFECDSVIWDMFGTCFVCINPLPCALGQVPQKLGCDSEYFWNMFGISLGYVWNIFVICLWYRGSSPRESGQTRKDVALCQEASFTHYPSVHNVILTGVFARGNSRAPCVEIAWWDFRHTCLTHGTRRSLRIWKRRDTIILMTNMVVICTRYSAFFITNYN